MRRLFALLLLLVLLPLYAYAEIILFEDENGKVIMGDDGEIDFLPPDESPVPEDDLIVEETLPPAVLPTPAPAERLIHTYGLDTPLPTAALQIVPAKCTGSSTLLLLSESQRNLCIGINFYSGKQC